MVASICLPPIARGFGEAIQWFNGVKEFLVGHSHKGEKGWSLGQANLELASEIGVGLDEGLLHISGT